MRSRLESHFEFEQLKANWRTEILAGVTTFVTMAYIIFVNPSILRDAGLPYEGAAAATCLIAGIGSILMGAFARYPIALAPGMGLNAYFAYTVVKGMGVRWEVALGAVFISGVTFLILTVVGVRRMIVSVIPVELYAAVAAGIGLFIALIGLRNAGIVVASPATLVTMGNLRSPQTLLSIFGLLLIAGLMVKGIRAAMLIGILGVAAAGVALGLIPWNPVWPSWSGITSTALRLDIPGALHVGALEIIFVFLFVDLFDNVGTLVGVAKKAGLFTDTHEIPRINRILFADASSTVLSAMAGTSTVVSYIESAAGVVAGGRTGIPAIVAGLLFLAALFAAPVLGVIPSAATAPALIIVGSLMMSHVAEIRWDDPGIAVPAFLTILCIPLTFSIANGLAFGFTSYTLLRVIQGKFKDVNWLMYALTLVFILRFVYLAVG